MIQPDSAALERPDSGGTVDTHRTMPSLATALTIGLVVGVLSLAGQHVLPGSANHLANSGAVWSVAAFAAGWFSPVRGRVAAVSGALTLAGAVLGYYVSTTLALHDDVNAATLRAPAVWFAMAFVAGPAFGFAGWLARGGRRDRDRAIGLGALGAAFLGEATYQATVNHDAASAATLCALGVFLPLAFARSGVDRRNFAIAVVPVAAVGAGVVGAAYAAINALLT